ncbi:MAG: hypothetical protein Q9200_004827 [Gallowayella weberi]
MDCWDLLFTASGGDGGKFGLDEAFEVGERLLGVDKKGKGFDVFAVQRHFRCAYPWSLHLLNVAVPPEEYLILVDAMAPLSASPSPER